MRFKIYNPKNKLRILKRDGQPFKLISTLLTKTIITDSCEMYYIAKGNLKMSELNLIKSVKDYVIKNNITTRTNRKKIQYIDNEILKNGIVKGDIYEIDLKSAYWRLAYKK